MSYIKYNIYKSSESSVESGVRELLRNISLGDQPIRLVFFKGCGDDYDRVYGMIRSVVDQWYLVKAPLICLVAQRTLDCRLAMEVHSVEKRYLPSLSLRQVGGVRYSILEAGGSKLLFTEGVRGVGGSVVEQGRDIFVKLSAIFDKEGFCVKDIDRQWNYIEDITGEELVCGERRQRYQEFNDARSEFYSNVEWSEGYPAATGIGTQGGGVVVEVDAALKVGMRSVAIDNQLQVSAHKYSEEVLIGDVEVKSTPKFERARAIVYESIFGDKSAQIYISGTAAIRGEDSLEEDVELQTVATLENIEWLIGRDNLAAQGVELIKIPKMVVFRVYLKRMEDMDRVRAILLRRYPTVSTLYVRSEVCRRELLIEIEGIAE